MNYTVTITHYNQNYELDICIDRWLHYNPKPDKIIVVDDDSKISPIYDNPIIETLLFEHCENLAFMQNEAFKKIKTEYFINTSATQYLSDNFISVSAERMKQFGNNIRQTGIMVKIKSLDYFPEIVFTPHTCINSPDIYINPPGPCLQSTSKFLWYNEIFKGYGYEDVDYYIRWHLGGNKFALCSDLVLYKYIKDKTGSFYKKNNNEEKCNVLKKYYEETKKVPIFNENNRKFYPL